MKTTDPEIKYLLGSRIPAHWWTLPVAILLPIILFPILEKHGVIDCLDSTLCFTVRGVTTIALLYGLNFAIDRWKVRQQKPQDS